MSGAMRIGRGAGAALWLVLGAAACHHETKPDQPQKPAPEASASATIEARSSSNVSGKATFTQSGDRVSVRVEIAGAAPGLHGVHIHEKGDCSDPEGKSAGGHFNPAGVSHGAPDAAAHHPGDFGNVTVGEDGKGTLELTTAALTVGEGANSVVGRAIIIHEKPDDLVTQPTGNAGGRIGCGVIQK